MSELRVSLGYKAREIFVPFHKRTQRRAVLVVHRRAGKTVANLADLIDAALRCKLERPRYAYLAPLYKQAKAVAWDYLKAMTAPIPGRVAHEAELRVDLPNGGRIQLYGADNPDALRGIYLDGAVLDEYAQMLPKTWTEVIGPALADRQGFATFIGTPKGRNAFCELYERAQGDPNWYAALHRASETGLLAPEVLDQARAEMAPEAIDTSTYGYLGMFSESLGGPVSFVHGDDHVTYWSQEFVNASNDLFTGGSPATLSAPHCSRMNSTSALPTCSSTCSQASANSASPAPAGNGRFSLVPSARWRPVSSLAPVPGYRLCPLSWMSATMRSGSSSKA